MIQVPPLLPGHFADVLALTPSPKMSGYLIMALTNTAMKKITLSLIILASTGFSIEVEVHPFSFLKAAESVAHQLMNSCRGYFF